MTLFIGNFTNLPTKFLAKGGVFDTDDWNGGFEEAVDMYVAGDWNGARAKLQECLADKPWDGQHIDHL